MQAESFDVAYRAARRQYELGRFAAAARHAVTTAILVGAVAWIMLGKSALAWLPVTVLVVIFTEWRGIFLMKGARRGLVAGVAAMLLPLSILRPCCGVDAKAMGLACCVMPSACWATGAVVGLAMALLLPKAPNGRRMEAAAGMILGVVSVAVLRCSMLFLGEAVGLIGGLAAGVIATSLARTCLDRLRAVA